MKDTRKVKHVAYRCPECADAIFGIVGGFADAYGMLRLKCTCDKSNMDIIPAPDKKLKISVPCVLCKQNHSYTVSDELFFNRDLFELSCPYSGFNIGFIGEGENVKRAIAEGEEKLREIIDSFGVETLSDLQPEEMSDAEILPDASVYDMLRFIVKDLEADGKADCPCHSGCYDLRYTENGLQAFCPDCGATYDFPCASEASAEKYLSLDYIRLS